ncbi:hypothetical protein BJY01DRAFT_219207 [Aspergillus pseudoustus]|uniref:Uncharacterized protein n=1 Tax=Aspergillus pseudoustus TaxID=1810923 RepID=A0ABR4JHG7_9EURO
MTTRDLLPRFLHRKDGSEIQLVIPGNDAPGTPRETLLSVQATTQDPSGEKEEEALRLLLGVNRLDAAKGKHDPPKHLRWMHIVNNGMEFSVFLRRALEAYGIDLQTQSTVSKFFDRFLALNEQSAFRGGRFRTVPASTKVQLPASKQGELKEEATVNFIAIPFFLLHEAQSPPKRPTASRAKVHWVQPLVQSGYHLDSSIAREHQQAIRRLYSHVKEILHIPQLWVLSIGDKFVATCSPTALCDGQSSSLITRTIGRDPFPPSIRVTTSSGLVFCLERAKCGVWFEFLYRVQSVMGGAGEAYIDTRNWVYKLETDGSLIDARRWRPLCQQHPENELLLILASPREQQHDTNTKPPEDHSFVPELRYPSDVSEVLTKLDQKKLAHRERRMHAGVENSDHGFRRRGHSDHPYRYIDPYYWPPDFVLEAARSQAKKEQGESVEAQAKADEPRQQKLPIFKWTLGKPTVDEAPDEPTPTQRMKSFLAYTHHDILFLSSLRLSRLYNTLPLATKSSVLKQIDTLRTKYHVNAYILDLILDFVRYTGDILDEFIDPIYDCIVKGKTWAAVSAVIEAFRFGLVESLLPFQIEILALPLEPALRQIQSIRDGLAGVAHPPIPRSLVEAFIQVVTLLVDLSAEASQLIDEIEHPPAEQAEEEQAGGTDPSPPPASDSAPPPNPPKARFDTSSNASARRPHRAYSPYSDHNRYDDYDDGPYSIEHREPTAPAFRPEVAIDQLFTQLSQAQDECCATYRSDEETPSAAGLSTIMALVLQSVLRGHSTCKEMPVLDLGEVYATYTTSLQLQARNRPSKNLLLDINLLREELETVTANIDLQLKLITDLRTDGQGYPPDDEDDMYLDETDFLNFEMLYSSTFGENVLIDPAARVVLQDIHTEMQERKEIFSELIKRVDILERQIVQRVDIIQEDHGKAILVFTIVSTIFLPLSFVSSYLGMNTADIRDMNLNQSLFWQVAVPVTVAVVTLVLVGAYNAGRILRFVSGGTL